MLIHFFIPCFYNTFHCFSSIMLDRFILFFPVLPNGDGPTGLCFAREMSTWYRTYYWYLCKKTLNLSSFTGKKSKCAILIHLSNLGSKTIFHCTVMGSVLMMSDTPLALEHLIITHGNRILLFHIHLYQVPLDMCWPCSYVIDEKELIL